MHSLDALGCSNAIVATLCFFIMDRRYAPVPVINRRFFFVLLFAWPAGCDRSVSFSVLFLIIHVIMFPGSADDTPKDIRSIW